MPAPFTIDPVVHPELQLRIDAFSAPAAARPELEAAMHRSLAFLKEQPGFLHHMVFEKTSGPSHFDLVTIAVWASPGAVEAASAAVRAYYQRIGFDPAALMARLGVTAQLGFYTAPPALQ